MADFKPEKVWRVGDKIFPDYVEAIKATTVHRQGELRKEIAQTIELTNDGDFPGALTFAEVAADRLIERFTITRKRAK